MLDYGAPVRGVSAGADGSRIAACGDDNLIRVWDTASGKELQRFAGHEMPALSVALAGDNKTLVSGSADKAARIWSIAATQLLQPGESQFNDLAYTPDGGTEGFATQADQTSGTDLKTSGSDRPIACGMREVGT